MINFLKFLRPVSAGVLVVTELVDAVLLILLGKVIVHALVMGNLLPPHLLGQLKKKLLTANLLKTGLFGQTESVHIIEHFLRFSLNKCKDHPQSQIG